MNGKTLNINIIINALIIFNNKEVVKIKAVRLENKHI